jgi:hypothetical protein
LTFQFLPYRFKSEYFASATPRARRNLHRCL